MRVRPRPWLTEETSAVSRLARDCVHAREQSAGGPCLRGAGHLGQLRAVANRAHASQAFQPLSGDCAATTPRNRKHEQLPFQGIGSQP